MGYQFETMTRERMEEFLGAPRNAIVGTIRKSGSPHLSPVWYLYENGRFYFPVQTDSVKYRNLARDPRASICVDGAFPDLRTVMAEGSVTMIADSREAEMYLRISRRYYESEKECREGAETFHQWGPVAVVEISPERMWSQDYQDWE